MEHLRTSAALHELLLRAVERAVEIHDTSAALCVEQRVLTGELRESVALLQRNRATARARRGHGA